MTSPAANRGAADADVQHKNKDRKAERARQNDPQRTFQKAFLSFCHRQLLFMTSTCEINAKVRQSFFNRVENSLAERAAGLPPTLSSAAGCRSRRTMERRSRPQRLLPLDGGLRRFVRGRPQVSWARLSLPTMDLIAQMTSDDRFASPTRGCLGRMRVAADITGVLNCFPTHFELDAEMKTTCCETSEKHLPIAVSE